MQTTYSDTVAVIGMGRFGAAIASLLEENGIVYEVAEVNKRLSVRADVAFITVPTQHIRKAVTDNRRFLSPETFIVNCSKGIEENTHLLPHQIVEQAANFPHYGSLLGPSYADEIISKNPTIVSLGSTPDYIDIVKGLLETTYFKIAPTSDRAAIELAGALKNVYAILCGYAHGLGFGTNTRVKIIMTALNEFQLLAKAANYPVSDVNIPAISGDLILTCSSVESRNYTYGYNLAKRSDPDPHETTKKTVEGFHTSHSITALSKLYQVELPLAALTTRLVGGDHIDAAAFASALANT